jgi:YidC/Oxa1 family membrane protein insertase
LDNNRLLIAAVIIVGVIVLYNQLLQWRHLDQYAPKSKQTQTLKGATPGAPQLPGTMQSPEALASPAGASAAHGPPGETGSITNAAERTVKVETNYYEAILTSRGARLVQFKLKKYRQTDEPNSPYYEMIRPGDRLPLGMVTTRGSTTIDDGDILYTTTWPPVIKVEAGTPLTLSFVAEKDGLKLQKTFTFSDSSYVFGLNAAVSAARGDASPGGIGLTMSQPLTALAGYRDYPTLQADVNGKALTEGEKPLEKGVQPVSGPIKYAGFGDRYFLAAFLPEKSASGTLVMNYTGDEANALIRFDDVTSVASRVYMGPKELDILEAADPALSKAIDLGFWGIIALPFLRALKIFYRIVPNYGVAIILLTVVVRLITLPMSIKGQRSMMKMQRLQPQVERIRGKFKDDQERLNHEMVELYKRNHVNPIGGCLPMVIQFPVFIGLYEALLNAVDLRHAPFILWIRDLSAPDCLPVPGLTIPFTDLHGIPVLVLLMTITAFTQQWISPRNPDPNQQKMMMYMPLAFSLIFIELPAGLSLYYFASNLLGVIQQFILNREFKQYTPVTTT